MIMQDKEGKLKQSLIIAFLPSNDRKQTKLSEKTIQNILNNEHVIDEGMFKFINLKGKLSYQIEYKNGKIYSYGVPVKGDEVPLKKRQAPAAKKNNKNTLKDAPAPGGDCIDWYIVTTYYDGIGGTYEEWDYLYTTCDGGGTGGGGSGSGNGDETINAEDPYYGYSLLVVADSIRLSQKYDCFLNMPENSNTTYSARICADIPNNSNPNALLNSSLSPGHAFIELTMTTGGTSITQTFGFYPKSSTKATFQGSVSSMVVDDENHPYDASLLMMLNANQFVAMMNTAISKANNQYSMTGYNCTDFALDVFNVGRSTPLSIGNTIGSFTSVNYGRTPNGLYNTIKNMHSNSLPGASIATGFGAASTACN